MRNKTTLIILPILLFGAGLAAYFYNTIIPPPPTASGQEIEKIKATKNKDEQVGLYVTLIERVGPTQAQEELYRSGLPFTGETHLLNHAVGEYLYKKSGAAGLAQCKDYFLSSCHHGFVISAIGSGGMPEVEKVVAECRKGGHTVVSQCSHAIGHGFLASEGYKNLTTALKMCDELSTSIKDLPIYNCLDGAFMENIWGVHDGTPSPDRWISKTDWFYPCNDPRINEKYLSGCWANQPSLMYQMFHGDLARVGQECLKVKNPDFKETCFNGLSRQIHPITSGDIDKVFSLCGLLPAEWINYCQTTVARSDFSVGGRALPFQICGRSEEAEKRDCYTKLFSTISAYSAPSQKTEFCSLISEVSWRTACKNYEF